MTLLAPDRPPAAPPRRRSPAARRATAAAVLAAAGLTAAACAAPAAHPHAASRPGARRLTAGPTTARSATPHPPPSVVPPTTPAARATGSSRPAPHPAAPTPTTTSAPAPGPSVTGAASPPPLAACATGGLRVSLGPPGSTAGSSYYPLQFTNVTAQSCTLYGYPGVSFVAAPGGRQLGGAAVRDPGAGPSAVVLAPGAVAHSALQLTVAQNYPASVCKPVTARWLQVYPPGQYAPAYVGLTATTCAGTIPGRSTLGIFVVRPGANGS